MSRRPNVGVTAPEIEPALLPLKALTGMPLLKIETRPKAKASDRRPEPRQSGARPPDAGPTGGGLLPIIAGGSLALLLLAGVAAVLLRRRPDAATPPAQVPVNGTAASMPGAVPAVGAGVVPTMQPLAALANIPPLNPDFPRESMVANIDGVPFLMADLEIAVRVARTIATLSADPVPNYDDAPGMRAFQVKLLRRQIDAILLENAARSLPDKPPPLSAQELIDSLLTRQSAARQQLDDAMAANGVAEANVVAFLQRAGDIDLFIQSEILKDLPQDERQNAERRDALVRDWLDRAWETQSVQIYFYDPDSVLPAEERGAEPATQP
ncbi:MAG: hypothetical protein IT332_04515 [Ardenticatenales bacterium]|nr:hypothetical protein [Ardenticatenales bacterium]